MNSIADAKLKKLMLAFDDITSYNASNNSPTQGVRITVEMLVYMQSRFANMYLSSQSDKNKYYKELSRATEKNIKLSSIIL